MDIELIRGEVTSLKVDAIVNATAGEDGVPSFAEATTPSGNLLCKYVIHVAAPRPGTDDPRAELQRTVRQGLSRAEDLRIRSVAFPAIHVEGLAADEVAEEMFSTVDGFRHRCVFLRKVVFCLFGDEIWDAFDRMRRRRVAV